MTFEHSHHRLIVFKCDLKYLTFEAVIANNSSRAESPMVDNLPEDESMHFLEVPPTAPTEDRSLSTGPEVPLIQRNPQNVQPSTESESSSAKKRKRSRPNQKRRRKNAAERALRLAGTLTKMNMHIALRDECGMYRPGNPVGEAARSFSDETIITL